MANVRIPNCFVCMDKGFVTYHKVTDGISYEYAAHCICESGLRYKYNGRNCEKPSDYYVPCISEILDPVELARQNFNDWYKIAKKKNPDILKVLKERTQGKTTKQQETRSEFETQPVAVQPVTQLPDNQESDELELAEETRRLGEIDEICGHEGIEELDESAEEIEIEIY